MDMYEYMLTCVHVLGCSDPPLHNAQNMIVDVPDKFTEGDKVNYTCLSRFELVGDNVLTCKSGKWVGDIPYCKGTCASLTFHFKSINKE